MLIVLVTSVTVIGMTTVIFYVEDMLSFHRHEVEHRESLAEILCRDTRYAININNRAHAAETLQSLARDPHILSAWVVLNDGEVFASYVRQPGEGGVRTVKTGGRLMLAPDALHDKAGALSGIFEDIKTVFSCTDGGKKICTIVIIADAQELKLRMAGYLVLVLLVLLGVTVVGYLITCRLQRIITDPLSSLVNTMERIRSTRDYSLRVESRRTDEIGILADCFNQMLHEVEAHGEQLHLYQDKLAEMIAIRTAELVRVKEQAEANAVNRFNDGRIAAAPVPIAAGLGLGTLPSQDERRMLYALMDCIDEEVWFISARSGLVMANRSAGESLGISLADCLDLEAYAEGFEIYSIDLNKLHRADLPPFSDLQGTSVRRMEVMLLKNETARCYQLISAEPINNDDGTVSGTVFVVRDITLLKETEELQRSSSRSLIEAEESLRKELAAELHDEIGRDIAALNLFQQVIIDSMPAEIREQLDDKIGLVHGLLDGLSCKVAGIISELRPPMLDDFGLSTALRCLVDTVRKQHEIEVDLFVDDGIPRFGGGVETALYRIAQEALNNAVKHSGADLITISLEEDEEQVRLTVSDNGSGFDPSSPPGTAKRPSWGVSIMRERAESVGGRFSLKSAPGAGTTITVQVERMLCQ